MDYLLISFSGSLFMELFTFIDVFCNLINEVIITNSLNILSRFFTVLFFFTYESICKSLDSMDKLASIFY